MRTTLAVLREREAGRFERLHADDTRTAVPGPEAAALAEELRRETTAEVRFDAGSRALYATDGSNYRQVPIGVVVPRTLDDVVAAVAACRRHGAPVLSRGGGTRLAGQCCNVAVVLDFSKHLGRVLEIDPLRRLARVQPGCVLDTLRGKAERHRLTFGPDPATHTHCTLGGMLGNDSCGVHSLLSVNAGLGMRTSDNTAGMEVLTYDGVRMRVGRTSPEMLERIVAAGGRRGEIYAALRNLRDRCADAIRRMPRLPRRVSGYNLDALLPENGFHVARALVGTESACVTILEATLHLVPGPPARSLLVLGYPDVFSAGDHVPEILPFRPTGLEGMDDLLFDYVRRKGDKDAHLGLLPPGRGWLLVEFGGGNEQEAHDAARRCADALRGRPGAPSIKHFDNPHEEEMIWKVREGGLGSTAWVPGLPDWDPDGRMNPGKGVDAYPLDANLRLGPDYEPPRPQTHFRFPHDEGRFDRAALRCVGVGKCRRDGGGVMCPSYMVTREEKHSTRGRAHLLWEMLNGEVLADGWRSEAVREALDLCLACKGCRTDCPVNVDMATYKAEFNAHYYEGRLRPRHAYAFGFVHVWSALASLMPRAANFVSRTPGLRSIARLLAGVDSRRSIPAFADERFKSRFARRTGPSADLPADAPTVLLFADTFNDFYHPDVAEAAVEVLEHVGFRVEVPTADLCCGRPLYDYGFLDSAKRWLLQILHVLRPHIRAGTPMVVLEPSCCAVFRDELTNLFPDDPDAQRLSTLALPLSGFLRRHAPGWKPPTLPADALVHLHCHHRSVLGVDDELALLADMGLDTRVPDSGCCGMAGAFGFEAGEHCDVSLACGERVLLPAVRDAAPDALLITNGFSCHEQIRQGAGREAVHFAQVLRTAIRRAAGARRPARPARRPRRGRAAVGMAAAAAAGVALGWWLGADLGNGRGRP